MDKRGFKRNKENFISRYDYNPRLIYSFWMNLVGSMIKVSLERI